MEVESFQIVKGADICDGSTVYTIEEVRGAGTYGKVAMCKKQDTGETVAVKFVKERYYTNVRTEVSILDYLRKADPEANHLINFLDSFYYEGYYCLVFELLESCLYGVLKESNNTPFRVSKIRVVGKQMLLALSALKSLGVTHMDIKPDNIMVADRTARPQQFKLIDFGFACVTSDLAKFGEIQVKQYRAPEVYLGLPLDEGVDMWALGCTLVFMFIGYHLFAADQEYEILRFMLKILGMPDRDSLDKGRHVPDFFKQEKVGTQKIWRLKEKEDYEEEMGTCIQRIHPLLDKLESLDDLLTIAPEIEDPIEEQDAKAFIDLLKKMLAINPRDRIQPADALNHPFITMEHFANNYVREALEEMTGFELADSKINNPESVNQVNTSDEQDSSKVCDSEEILIVDSKPETSDQIENPPLIIEAGLCIRDGSTVYKVQGVLGHGSFGKVTMCTRVDTGEKVAVKFVKKTNYTQVMTEAGAHLYLQNNDLEGKHLIKFFKSFPCQEYYCLVFELLEVSLHDLWVRFDRAPFAVTDIRLITKQMLLALEILKHLGVTHSDIKPDNIMLADSSAQPYQFKLIDFGLACMTSELSASAVIQNMAYRAPEVYLGVHRDEGVDMWALGCSLAFLFVGFHLFRLKSEYEIVRFMVKILGMPNRDMLDKGYLVSEFFTQEQIGTKKTWRLKTILEYERENADRVDRNNPIFNKLHSLDDILFLVPQMTSQIELEDAKAFIDLLKKMLAINPEERIHPSDALNHPFITMENLTDRQDSYVGVAFEAMEGHLPVKSSSVSSSTKRKRTTSNDWGSISGSEDSDVILIDTQEYGKKRRFCSTFSSTASPPKKRKTLDVSPVNNGSTARELKDVNHLSSGSEDSDVILIDTEEYSKKRRFRSTFSPTGSPPKKRKILDVSPVNNGSTAREPKDVNHLSSGSEDSQVNLIGMEECNRKRRFHSTFSPTASPPKKKKQLNMDSEGLVPIYKPVVLFRSSSPSNILGDCGAEVKHLSSHRLTAHSIPSATSSMLEWAKHDPTNG